MPLLGITGGIATGKSRFGQLLLRELPGRLFDADQASHDLLANNQAVRAQVASIFGPGILGADPKSERARLREIVFADAAKRTQLEGILHPLIHEAWKSESVRFSGKGDWFYVDLPLLFEAGTESAFDGIVVVACSRETQLARLRHARSLGEEMANQILATQLDLDLKTRKADHLIWNDSTIPALEGQTALLARLLSIRYG